MSFPSCCFFGLDKNDFSDISIDEEGIKHYTNTVTQKYFKDFSNNNTKESASELPKDEQPTLVIITNPNEFFKRIIDYFIKLGLKREEILINPVKYIDKTQGFYSPKEVYPRELFLKDISFAYQREVRVVINTKNKKVLKELSTKNNIINIGDLSDITHIEEFYYDKDMLMEKRGNRLLYVLSEPKTFPLEDLSKEELLALVHQITNEDIRKLSKHGIETNEQIMDIVNEIEKILRSKYN